MMQQSPGQAAAAPQAPVAPAPGAPPTAAEMLQAARAHRQELRNTLNRVEEQREDIQEELTQTPQSEAVVRAGLETRLKDLDARILALDKEIDVADQRVAQAAGVPGATYEPPPTIIRQSGPPEEVFMIGGMLIFFIGFPLAIAYARRLWKKGAVTVNTEMPAELSDRLGRMEQAIDAVAVELERVGEGQRYVTKVFSDSQRALGAAGAQPVEVRQREAIPQNRP